MPYYIQKTSPCGSRTRLDEEYETVLDALEARDEKIDSIPDHFRGTRYDYRVVDDNGTIYEYHTSHVDQT